MSVRVRYESGFLTLCGAIIEYMNTCYQCAGPIPTAIDQSSSVVEYCPHCDATLHQSDRSGPPQWLP